MQWDKILCGEMEVADFIKILLLKKYFVNFEILLCLNESHKRNLSAIEYFKTRCDEVTKWKFLPNFGDCLRPN